MNGYLNLSWMECNNNADEILPWLYSLLHCRSVVFLYIYRDSGIQEKLIHIDSHVYHTFLLVIIK